MLGDDNSGIATLSELDLTFPSATATQQTATASQPLPNHRTKLSRCLTWLVTMRGVLLLLLPALTGAYWPYPDPGPDIPPSHQFCTRRPGEQCCPGRDDYCTMPILDTLCYCDVFCNRTVSDCCPDFWGHCMGIEPPPGARTVPPPPVTAVISKYRMGSVCGEGCGWVLCVGVGGGGGRVLPNGLPPCICV